MMVFYHRAHGEHRDNVSTLQREYIRIVGADVFISLFPEQAEGSCIRRIGNKIESLIFTLRGYNLFVVCFQLVGHCHR